MRHYPRPALAILPVTRWELPAWGRLYRMVGADREELWRSVPRRTIRGKWHGYLMELDLANWSERLTYFLGRFYQLDVQLCLDALLAPGDSFVDVGANIGMVALHAARRVGPSGRVVGVEPNPDCCRRIRRLVELNALANVTLFEAGLSDAEGRLTLRHPAGHTGTGTFAGAGPGAPGEGFRAVEVEVRRGDDLLGPIGEVDLIKIDVEGFELRVLRGLRGLLERCRPSVLHEAAPELLRRAGACWEEVAGLMGGLGYEGFGLSTRREWGRHRLELTPIAGPCPWTDVLWVHPVRARAADLVRFVAPAGGRGAGRGGPSP